MVLVLEYAFTQKLRKLPEGVGPCRSFFLECNDLFEKKILLLGSANLIFFHMFTTLPSLPKAI